MEFFYMLTFCEDYKILGSNLYYSQDEFDKIVNEIKQEYFKLFDSDLENNELVLDYVSRKLIKSYQLQDLHISSFGNCHRYL